MGGDEYRKEGTLRMSRYIARAKHYKSFWSSEGWKVIRTRNFLLFLPLPVGFSKQRNHYFFYSTMVQTTSQFVALLTFALGTLTTGYAAPTARASNDCGTNLTMPLLLSVTPIGSSTEEHPIELFQKSQDIAGATTDYVWTVSFVLFPPLSFNIS